MKNITIFLLFCFWSFCSFAQNADLIPYRKGDKWGFAKPDKTILIPCKYEEVGDFSEGLAKVMLNNKWGFVDKAGKEVIAPKYGQVGNFSEGLASVELNSSWALLIKQARRFFRAILARLGASKMVWLE